MPDTAEQYDAYWATRDAAVTRARSEARAELAIGLLRGPGGSGGERGGPRRLLDVGCGPGWGLRVLTAAGFEAEGIDVSPSAVASAREAGLAARCLDLEGDPLAGPFDVITAFEVLEHLLRPLPTLEKLRDALSPDGRLVVSLPNEFHLLRRLGMLAGRAPVGGHDDPHVRHFDDRLARRLFAAAGLEVHGRASDPLPPPRRPLLRRAARPLARAMPGLFALSNVYLLTSNAEQRSDATR